jgi:hypothetical protein
MTIGYGQAQNYHCERRRVHDQQEVTGNEAIGPAMRMLVELHRRSHRQVLAKKLEERGLYLAVALLGRLYDGFGIYAFMDVQGDGRPF